ncbi:hypothetical protein TNCT_374541 [Trichonephila clavata]|uniref:Uncharacterized protein n=1 Tax=Trichonephila clavata TaxID=2740835 RepID=A0A8X6G6J4_TRICU|nr:hypothetical protein TNCT_374541 [Trichonephila clavata]
MFYPTLCCVRQVRAVLHKSITQENGVFMRDAWVLVCCRLVAESTSSINQVSGESWRLLRLTQTSVFFLRFPHQWSQPPVPLLVILLHSILFLRYVCIIFNPNDVFLLPVFGLLASYLKSICLLSSSSKKSFVTTGMLIWAGGKDTYRKEVVVRLVTACHVLPADPKGYGLGSQFVRATGQLISENRQTALDADSTFSVFPPSG